MKVIGTWKSYISISFPAPGPKRTFLVICLLHVGAFSVLLFCTKKTDPTFLRLFSQLPVRFIQKDTLAIEWQLGKGRITFLALFLALALSPMWFPTLVGSLCSDSGVYLIDLAPGLCKRFITLFFCPTSRSSFLLLLISGLLSLPLFGFAMLPIALLTSSHMKFLLQNYPTFTLSLDWHIRLIHISRLGYTCY